MLSLVNSTQMGDWAFLSLANSTQLGEAATLRKCEHDGGVSLAGPMWVGPMHDEPFVRAMKAEAERRGWDDAAELLQLMEAEASAQRAAGSGSAELEGALLFYHLGELQRRLAAAGLRQPPLAALIELLHNAGYTASRSHMEKKALVTSASETPAARSSSGILAGSSSSPLPPCQLPPCQQCPPLKWAVASW